MDAAKKYQDGHIDVNAYKAAVEAIYGVVAGLVSTQVAETVNEAVNAVSKHLEVRLLHVSKWQIYVADVVCRFFRAHL